MDSKLLGYVKLARPANLPTAAADILAGVAISGILHYSSQGNLIGSGIVANVLYLVFASIFLYAGGVILNDVFDIKVDKLERPERPIPKGIVPLRSAALFGTGALVIGTVLAFWVNSFCGIVAVILSLFIVLYDAISKKHAILGPLNMGACRGLNLILGMSIPGGFIRWEFALIPLVYIFAITLISRGEVHGNNKNHIVLAGVLYLSIIFAVMAIAFIYTDNILLTALFLVFFAILIYRPLVKAYLENSPHNIKKAVIAGVLSLIVLDASLAVGFSSFWYGLGILLLLPVSIILSKLFAVT